MKHFRPFAVLVALVAVTVSVTTGVAIAASKNVTIHGTTNHSIYQTGQDIRVSGVVNGDIICAGQTVTIDATVNGDIICAGQTVSVDGSVNGNVRLAGQTVRLGAKVARRATLVGQDVTLQSGASVANDLGVTGQTALVESPIGRDIAAKVGTLTIDNKVGRNVEARTNQLHLDNGAVIQGNLTYTSSHHLQKNGSAQVLGKTSRQTPQTHHHAWSRLWWAGFIYWLVALVVFAVVLAALFPRLLYSWGRIGRAHFWLALLIGFLAMFIIPAIMVALFVTVIGVPLGLLLLLVWFLLAALSFPVAASLLGGSIIRNHTVLAALVGAIILAVLFLIPFVGWIFVLLAYWVGVGTLLLGMKDRYQRPVYRPH